MSVDKYYDFPIEIQLPRQLMKKLKNQMGVY